MRMNPKVSAFFTADGARRLSELEDGTGRFFPFTGSEGLPLDHFTIVQEGARDEIEEQSVPFREGEEVHVDIVEPHMYSEDDAVAKIDGYLIEVADGIAYVGEKMLVRIEQAGRTSRAGGADRRRRRGGCGGDRRAAQGARAGGQACRVGRAVAAPKKKPEPAPVATQEDEAVETLTDDHHEPCTRAPAPPRPRRPTRTPRSRAGGGAPGRRSRLPTKSRREAPRTTPRATTRTGGRG